MYVHVYEIANFGENPHAHMRVYDLICQQHILTQEMKALQAAVYVWYINSNKACVAIYRISVLIVLFYASNEVKKYQSMSVFVLTSNYNLI